MIITLDNCKDLNDNEIVERSRENLDYFSCLYQRYEIQLMHYIVRLSGVDREEAQDILQESFIKIWRNLNEFDSALKFSSWAYRIVHNETISYTRKKKSYGKANTLDMEHLKETLYKDDETGVDAEEKDFITREVLNKLPMKYKEVLVLRFFEKKSYEEISDILKLPEGTVAVRINRAKKIFRENIERKN
jgi:RNA polymerase sigma-70 factor (ECF subfamily)